MGFLTSGALGGISQFPAALSVKGKQEEFFLFQLLSFLATVESVEMTLLYFSACMPMLAFTCYTFRVAQQPLVLI